jgi:hypothetical protein
LGCVTEHIDHRERLLCGSDKRACRSIGHVIVTTWGMIDRP